MENQNAQVVNSQELLASIFGETTQAPVTEPIVNQVEPTTKENAVEPKLETEPVVEPPVSQTIISSDYSNRLKSDIKYGFLENFAITYNDKEVYLEDIEDLTEEGYQQILAGYRAEKEKERKEKYIPVENLDEQTRKLIEVKQAGGNISEIIKENITAIEQLEGLKANLNSDNSNLRENTQINIVAYNLQQKGLSKKLIDAQLQEYIENGVLEEEANTIIDSHLAIQADKIEEKRRDEFARIEKEKEELKNLRKNISSKYKEWGIPDNIQKVLVENATKLDNDKISNTDKLYFEAVKNPEMYAELTYFLSNPAEFKKWVASKKVLETKVENAKGLFTVNLNNTKKPTLAKESLEDYADKVINDFKQK